MQRALRRLLERIDDEMHQTAGWTGRDRLAPEVRRAMEHVPREAFVPPEHQGAAYDNRPLPIGHGQTISQPFVVALMVDLVDPRPEHVALEVGTGCGYAAAVLSLCVARVETVEVVPALAGRARERLARLGYLNITVHESDGNAGWPDEAPYDAIVVTAAAPDIPQALVEQLAPGGRMVIPVGRPFEAQELVVVEKDPLGGTRETAVLPVAFVPLVEG